MANIELEEKINKIRLQNEEIKRRYEEVEADKKNAAKLNALVQLVPSDDWPERKEPPEFSAPPKNMQKQKVNKEHNDRPQQHYSGAQERHGKKDHKFAQGDGPPPDPKYNFLADSERELRGGDDSRPDEERSRNKAPRGGRGRRGGTGGGTGGGGAKEAFFKDNRGPHAFHSREDCLPEYEAWRAERNRIDEARINRQKTAEGNWRREWDNNKTSTDKEPVRRSESNRKDSSNYERRTNHYENDLSNRGHGGTRTYHGSQKNHSHQDYRHPHSEQPQEYKRQQSNNKAPLSPTDDRTVTANDKNIKVTVNPANQSKAPVMSVKVNSPSIAGTGRVGPRQKSRITYSSQSDADVTTHELNTFSRQKSFDEKTAAATFNSPKPASKSPFPQRKKDSNSKSPFPQRKEFKSDESSPRPKNQTKAPFSQRNESKDQKQSNNYIPKQQRIQKKTTKLVERLDNFSPDEALPSEYKSFNNENSTNQIINNGNINVEDALNKSNEIGTESSDTSAFLDDSIRTTDSVDQGICSNDNETCENKEKAEIDNDFKDAEIKEDIQMNENIKEIEVEDKTEYKIEEDINKDKLDAVMSNNVSNDSIGTDNSEKTPKSEDCETLEQKIEVILKQEEENKKICVSVSQLNSEILETPRNDEPKATVNTESQEVVDVKSDAVFSTVKDDVPSEFIESEQLQITDLNISEVKSLPTVGDIKNMSIRSDETKTTELEMSQNESVSISEMIQLEQQSTVYIKNDSLDKSGLANDVKNESIESNEAIINEIGASESKSDSISEMIQLEQQSTIDIKKDSLNESGFADDVKNESLESNEAKTIKMGTSESKSISNSELIQLEQQPTIDIIKNNSVAMGGLADDVINESTESDESKTMEIGTSETKSVSNIDLIQLEQQITDFSENNSLDESSVANDIKNESIESNESKTFEMSVSQNKSVSDNELIQLEQQATDITKNNSLDESGVADDINDESIESNESKTFEMSTSQKKSVSENELIKLEKQTTDITTNNSLDESGIADDIKNESMESNESKTIEKSTSENKSVSDNELIKLEQQTTDISEKKFCDESGILDDIKSGSIESDEAKIIEMSTSQNRSVNDSSLEEKSDKVQNNFDASILEFSTQNNTKISPEESEKSDLGEPTKEICEKTIEICDIHSAASSEYSQKDEAGIKENENKPEICETLEYSAKDSTDDIKDVNESSESSKIMDLKQVTANESPEKEESIKEELTNVATDESKE